MLLFHRLAERKTTWQVHQSFSMRSWYLHLFSINLHEIVTLGRRQNGSDVCVRDRRQQQNTETWSLSYFCSRSGQREGKENKYIYFTEIQNTLHSGVLYALISLCG